MATTPNNIETGAACYKCIPQGDVGAALVYLLNLIANTGMTPNQLQAAAACYKCIAEGDRGAVLIYLASLVAGVGTGLQIIYYTTNPNDEALTPANPNSPAIALTQNGGGQMYSWNITNQNWN